MNKGLIKKFLPHLIAIGIFLIVAVVYCKPALQGQVLNQSDITQWKGMSKSLFDYKAKHGHFALWTNSMFSGMPAYQIAMESDVKFSPGILHFLFTLGLPKPMSFFFLACICFYFLSQVLRVNPYIGIIAALAFAYTTYNIGDIEAGHDTKVQTVAYLPAFIASLLLVYERKYLLGAALTALFSMLLISMNHMQIVYYAGIIALFMTIGYLFWWVREKQIKHALLSIGIVLVAGVIGILCNAVNILTTLDASKTTIRGGTELPDKNATKTGLSTDYALSYSMYKTEPFVMMVPKMYGGSGDHAEIKEDDSKAVEALRNMPREAQQQLGSYYFSQTPDGAIFPRTYWGGIGPIAPNVPFYLGAIICFLGLIGFFILDNKHKWWMLATMFVSFLMAWGSYFEGFNTFLLHNLPAYNKFRVPSMIIIIPIFLLATMAILTLQKIVYATDKEEIWNRYKKGLMLAGGLFVVLFLIYLNADFVSQTDQEIAKQSSTIPQQVQELIRQILSGLKDDRKSLFLSSIFRSLLFIAVAAVVLWLNIKNKISGVVAFSVIGVFSFIDLISVDNNYLNSDSYQDQQEYAQNYFTPSELDKQLMQDTSFYRVLDRRQRQGTGGAMTAYFHNSIEGYHPAKLSIYQDLVEHQISKLPQTMHILNMLNTKYILQSDDKGQDVASINSQNLGPVWFVNAVRFEDSPQAVMNALNNFNPKDTAIAFAKDKSLVSYSPGAPGDSIWLVKNNNDEITYRYNASSNRFAVFSEVFYDKGWKAYVDGKELPIVRTNYALRGLSLPAGQNKEVKFVFHPSSFYTGEKIALFGSIMIWLLIIGTIVQTYRKSKAVKA